jgi:hypothetical protein
LGKGAAQKPAAPASLAVSGRKCPEKPVALISPAVHRRPLINYSK